MGHRWASPELLDRVARMPADEIQRAARRVAGVEGCIALVTCHRAELYVEAPNPRRAVRSLTSFFEGRIYRGLVEGADPAFRPTSELGILQGEQTVRHLFRVASGLDSRLVGETEIQGQVRAALLQAQRAKTASAGLVRLFRHALRTGRVVRARAGLEPTSLGAAVVQKALAERGSLGSAAITIVGAGSAATSVARALRRERPKRLLIVNRTLRNARKLASQVGATAVPFSRLGEALAGSDVVVFAAPLAEVPDVATGRSSLWIHLDRPTSPAGHGARTRIGLDDVLGPTPGSSKAVRAAERIITNETRGFVRLVSAPSTPAGRLLRRLQADAERVRSREVEKALRKLSHLAERDKHVIAELTRSIRTKLTLAPTLALNAAVEDGRTDLARAAEELLVFRRRRA